MKGRRERSGRVGGGTVGAVVSSGRRDESFLVVVERLFVVFSGVFGPSVIVEAREDSLEAFVVEVGGPLGPLQRSVSQQVKFFGNS